MKEINVNGVTILEYENEKIYSNQRCILVLNGVAAILAIIIAISYIIINTLSDSWVLSWSDYILYVEAVLMPVALFFGSLKDGGRPSRFTDIELVRLAKRYNKPGRVFKPSKKEIDHFPMASSILVCMLPIIFQLACSIMWGWANHSIVIIFHFLGETFLSYIFVYISTIIAIINCSLMKKEWDANPPKFAQTAINKKETEKAKTDYEKKKTEHKILIEKCGIRFFIKYYEQIQSLPLRDVIISENYDSAERAERLTAAKEIVDRNMTEFSLREILNAYSGILEETEIEKIKTILSEYQNKQTVKQGEEDHV